MWVLTICLFIPKFKVGKCGRILLKHLQHFRWLIEWFRRVYTHIQHTAIPPGIQKLFGSRVATQGETDAAFLNIVFLPPRVPNRHVGDAVCVQNVGPFKSGQLRIALL